MKPAGERIVCLSVPLFPLAARLRSEPDLRGKAVVIHSDAATTSRVIAASRRARDSGIRPGMTLPQARALLPELHPLPRDPLSEETAQAVLLEVGGAFSPRIEDAGSGEIFLSLAGLGRRLTGSETPTLEECAVGEVELAHQLLAAIQRQGLIARAGIADGKLAARVATTHRDSPHRVPPGGDLELLAPLPLTALEPDAETATIVERWGIRSIGAFARLPANRVASRLGPAGRLLHQRARGHDMRPFLPYRPPFDFHESATLDWPLTRIEPFLFIARTALERLTQRLSGRGLGCSRLRIDLEIEPRGHHQRSLSLPAPTRDVKTLLTLLRLDLEANPPGATVVAFRLTAEPDHTRAGQLDLFGPRVPAPDRLATTLARLASLLGRERMGTPGAPDGHCPERFAISDFTTPRRLDVKQGAVPAQPNTLAIRVIRPPLPLEVIVKRTPGEVNPRSPMRLSTEISEATARRPRIQGRVRIASGPWKLEEGWWKSEPGARREYWDVELENGALYRIFRESPSGDWFADGFYD